MRTLTTHEYAKCLRKLRLWYRCWRWQPNGMHAHAYYLICPKAQYRISEFQELVTRRYALVRKRHLSTLPLMATTRSCQSTESVTVVKYRMAVENCHIWKIEINVTNSQFLYMRQSMQLPEIKKNIKMDGLQLKE